MAITIKRNTGIIGSGIALSIKINGEKAAKVPNDQMMELEIPGDKATVSVSQLGVKSNEVEVKDGGKLEITTRNWIKYSWILFIIALAVVNITLASSAIIAQLILIILFAGCYIFIDGFQLKFVELQPKKMSSD